MRLLVSVRTAAEVEPALAGGADILDAKEPSRGSLGAVAPDTLAEILQRIPGECPISVALGDLTAPSQVATAIASVKLPRRSSPIFLKLGFAGVRSPETVRGVLDCAVATVQESATVVAVAYADSDRAGSLDPEGVLNLAHQAGAGGVLLDTHTKDGRGLVRWLTPGQLASWVSTGRGLGLLMGLAGEIRLSDLDSVSGAGPDVIGVRGAACEGGRGGRVTAERVRALRQRLREAISPAV
jgi:uncharacterized protein (UPF0264 family)